MDQPSLRAALASAEQQVEALRTALAKAIWADCRIHPDEGMSLARVVFFFLEHEGAKETGEILDFLTRIDYPIASNNPINVLGVALRKKPDLFTYDSKRRTWNIKKQRG